MKSLIYIACFIILIIVGLLFYNDSMVVFRPVQFQKTYNEINADTNFYKRLGTVLAFYKVKYVIKDKKLYIKRSLAKDTDLMCNYTEKAIGSVWIRKHIK